MVSRQNESAFCNNNMDIKKGKLYIQANFEIFCDILRAGCHRLDLKEKKKSFHFSEQHQHRAEKPVGFFLPHFVPPVNLWQDLCPCCTEAFLLVFVLHNTAAKDVSWSS